jgi:toxin ParE1/3/4
MTRKPAGPDALRLRISSAAKADIEDLLAWSEQRFGVAARRRYEALLTCALRDVAEDGSRPGVRARPELGAGVFSYHLFFSRKRAARGSAVPAIGAVQQPRHLVVWRIAEPGFADILRVLHDAMEISRHVPRADDNGSE